MKTALSKINPVWFLLLIILPLAMFFWFGTNHLTQFETADEHLWVSNLHTGRIQKYWTAIANKEWKDTRINDKPGITLALISGIGTYFEKNTDQKILRKNNLWTIYNTLKTKEAFFIYRLPIVIFNGLMSLFFLWALWRLTGKPWLALAASSLILLSPILIGISQIINPDSLLWVFSFAGILSFFLFLIKTKFIDGFLTALFLGLALLSKYVALIFFPFFLVMLLGYLLFYYRELIEKNEFRKKSIKITIGYLLIIAGSVGIFALGMPAALINKNIIYKTLFQFSGMQIILRICIGINLVILLDGIIFKSFAAKFLVKHLQFIRIIMPKALYAAMIILATITIANWSFGKNFLHTPPFEVDGGRRPILLTLPFYQQMALQAKPLLFSLTPITLLLMIFVWIKSLFRKSAYDYIIFMFSLFFIVFFEAVTQQQLLVHVRYLVILYPFALALAGFGFYEIINTLKNRFSFILFLLLILISSISIWKIRPFYFNYANAFLPKNSLVSTSWGYGGYEAAQYLKSQGDPQYMRVWTNYFGFCPFFSGRCYAEGTVKWVKKVDIAKLDYIIVSNDGMERNKTGLKRINQVFPTDNPVWKLEIGGRPDNFIYVYKNPLKQ